MNMTPIRPLSAGKVITISALMCACLFLVVLLSLLLGTAEISFDRLVGAFSGSLPAADPSALIIFKIRLPRIILAGLVGFSLSLGGVVFQALLRNPLADPFILGISSGSALGAIMGIVLGFSFAVGVPFMSFAGALLTIYLVVALGTRKMGMESSTILLTGVILNAFFTAIIMFFISTASSSRLYTMLFWLFGDLSQSHYGPLAIIAPVVVAASIVLYGFSKHLNIITAGEESAVQLGVEIKKAKMACLLVVSLIIGLVVSFSGLIGFVGLIVPHLARMAFGSDHRMLIPVGSLGGAIFLIVADTLARTVISPSELPVGVITAFLGAPFFIYLLMKRGSQWSRS
ncbi:MAG: iron ABC transporter permease [Deltaproteobacteria bacterium]|nr:iron ABC transporter permease [Deltaproteobacteria bacterium]MBW1920925.1 iron ABC transporter permease [Deltaproteobacteria bacterium]MBW1934956.1 iron ABC transporter permease [Deltaproteobacteria bacterium]MBW1976822.1 iron ABC transporter permease [Deltaproteobacteria bacterium]MBW2043737.1 iron ABC transporter permease [Deltaproteobacteria bacterium]